MGKMEVPIVSFPSADEFEKWLQARHASSDGVWLKLAKKGASKMSISYAEALDVALCYGWIDGQKDRVDDQHWLQRFTPRTGEEQVVEDQPRQGAGAHRQGKDAAGRSS